MKIDLRGDNVNIPGHIRELIEKRCRFAFGRLAGEAVHVRIVLRDLNGPKRGVDIEASVDVRLRRGAEIRAEATDVMVQRAAERALERAARAAHRVLARRHDIVRDSMRTPLPDELAAGVY